jgi:hypothetical protein
MIRSILSAIGWFFPISRFCLVPERILDCCYRPAQVFHHIHVPEAQNPIALRLQEGGSFGVVFLLIKVMAAIQGD